jgi:hypothetical protein
VEQLTFFGKSLMISNQNDFARWCEPERLAQESQVTFCFGCLDLWINPPDWARFVGQWQAGDMKLLN